MTDADGHDSATRLEFVHVAQDPVTGLRACIAIHNTARGPAFGGCRMRSYESEHAAITDAARLAEGMTLKNALAGLPFGGGKAVIFQPEEPESRAQLFRAFGREVERLGGRYITAEDVGTTPEDMRAVNSVTRFVSGIPRSSGFGGDPGRFTAMGVFHAIRVAARTLLDQDSLEGLQIGVQGLGAVGAELCALLAAEKAELWVSDLVPLRAADVADRWGAKILSSEALFEAELDILSPCALGAVFDVANVGKIQAKVIAGAANNQLASLEIGDVLDTRGIWYLPDFLINAGGIIAVAREYLGTGSERAVRDEVQMIGPRVEQLIHMVRKEQRPPARIAMAWAERLLQREARATAD